MIHFSTDAHEKPHFFKKQKFTLVLHFMTSPKDTVEVFSYEGKTDFGMVAECRQQRQLVPWIEQSCVMWGCVCPTDTSQALILKMGLFTK